MKYNIISINDDRKAYKDKLREHCPYEELDYPAVIGAEVNLQEAYAERGLRHTDWNPTYGEAGVWLSNFDRWMIARNSGEDLLVFEDDAIIGPEFGGQVEAIKADLPHNWDFCALWVPENQHHDYRYNVSYDKLGDQIYHGELPYHLSLFQHSLKVAKVYQGYGMVALMYSPRGGNKLVSLAREKGVCTPVDCFIYQQAHLGRLNGFAPTPTFATVVKYDWAAETTVHNTERVE